MKAPRPSRIASLATFKPRVDKQLRAVFASALTDSSEIDESYARLIEQLQDQTLRAGKRMRPYIAYLAYVGSGGRDTEAFMQVAASLELLHQFLLAHDDIIDRDFVRYGGPNIAGTYSQQFLSVGLPPVEAIHYATSYALLAGDASWTLAHRTVLSSGFGAARKLRAFECLEGMLFQVLGGQLMDVQNGVPGAAPASKEQLLGISRYKTATYTFQGPLHLGAILAGVPRSHQARLSEFGMAAGIAFQLADDILGVFGDEEALGKSVLSDMREGKQTLLLHYAYRGATPGQTKTLKRIWGQRTATSEDLADVQEIVRQTKSLEAVTALADEHLSESLVMLEQLPLSAPAKAELMSIAKFSVSRNY